MANREKGEIDLPVGSKTYTLVLNTAGMIAGEAQASTPTEIVTWDQVMGRMLKGQRTAFCIFIYAMTRKYHADLTFSQVCDLMDDVGGPEEVLELVKIGQQAMTPDPEDTKDLGARPRQAQTARSPGARSTSKRGRSV